MGFAWIAPDSAPPRPPRRAKRPQPIAEENVLRNEHIEVHVHPETGGIHSIRDHRYRGNLLSQQLGLRLPARRPEPGETWRDPDQAPPYSAMVADAVEVAESGPLTGRVVSRGRLVDERGKQLARFVQQVSLTRASRVMMLDLELEIDEPPRADPWRSYYACRFAWSDESATLGRGVPLGFRATEITRIESPYFVEIDAGNVRLAMLSGGLPYHARTGMRMLDTLLVARGESQMRFRLGVGVDLKQPAAAALDLLAPLTVLHAQGAPPAGGASGWLFHVDARSVVATNWEPLVEPQGVAGFRVRLLETLGRSGKLRLSALRPLTAARQLDLAGQPIADVPIEDGTAAVDYAAHEWLELEARWQL
jgi:alpha-mannosidase